MGLLLVFVALVVALSASAPALAATRVVTNFEDDVRNPPTGSFRLVLRQSGAGDTISFAENGTVELAGPLENTKAGLTVTGPATIRADPGPTGVSGPPVVFRGERVTITGVTFEAVLRVEGGGSVVTGNTFRDEPGRKPPLQVGDESNPAPIVVRANVFQTRFGALLILDRSNVRIVDNRFELAGGGAIATYPRDRGRRIEILANSLTGRFGLWGIRVDAQETLVAGNVISASGEAGIKAGGTIRNNRLRGSGITVTGTGFRVVGNMVSGAPANGIHVEGPPPTGPHSRPVAWPPGLVSGNTVIDSRGHGIVLEYPPALNPSELGADDLPVHIRGGSVRNNGGHGIFVVNYGKVHISGVRFGGNRGQGIQLGRLPDAPDSPVLRYDRNRGKLEGTTCPSCLVEVHAVEDEPRVGNEGGGEGIRVLGRVRADARGEFVFPARGSLQCPESGEVTATTVKAFTYNHRYGPRWNQFREQTWFRTSEFARNVECACVYSGEFDIVPKQVPASGFNNFGIAVSFPRGTTIREVELLDTKTGRRPPAGYGAYPLEWREVNGGPEPDLGEGRERRDFFGSFSPTRDARYEQYASAPTATWRFRITYVPSRRQPCDARPGYR